MTGDLHKHDDAATRQRAREALARWFGFDRFRGGQEDVVAAVLAGRDVLTVMPTGGGKSLCYQLPALLLDGVTLVVSPLIALMKDQVDALHAKGIAATVINSMVDWNEQQHRLDEMKQGGYKLVYIAPERFRSRAFLNALAGVPVSLMAVDEAHCLSQWGHDFRPDYLRLGEARQRLGMPAVAAFTATATPLVRADIIASLGLRGHFELVSGFARPNLEFDITPVSGKDEKEERLAAIIAGWKTGIVYCSTRKSVEDVAQRLRDRGLKPVEYHAGMDDKARKHAQEMFIARKRDIAVATNAFGMGIDRGDVRFVVHWELPGSVEAWYQEAGRAGRDGLPGHCELLFNFADKRTQDFFIEGSNPGERAIRQLYQDLLSMADNHHEVQLSIEELTERVGERNSMAISSALGWLVRAGVVERFDIPGQRKRGTRLTQPDTRARDLVIDKVALEEKERRDWARLEAMVNFCYSRTCRQGWVLDYFGEKHAPRCGHCDYCRAGAPAGAARQPRLREATWLRMALSGVARSCRREQGEYHARFGRQKIMRMLRGDKAAELVDAGLANLSTYGLLAELDENYVRTLFDAMEAAELVQTALSGDYPLLGITAAGEEVMRGGSPPDMVWPEPTAIPAPARTRPARKAPRKAGGKKRPATSRKPRP